ncbi:MAG: CoA transferase, partial [Thermoleophilia bacterium]
MQELTDPTQPLAALRVLDFGQYLAGPAVALLLADQGADVLHIDPPGGARWESNATALLNRGKRSVVLDLKQRADVSAAKELVATADVLVENFRPRVMNRLGLGPE